MAKTNLEKYLRPILDKVADRKIAQLRASLVRQGHKDNGKLYDSIKAKVVIRSQADFFIEFTWLSKNFRHNYGDALNFGADVGYLDEAGRARLATWVGKKFKLDSKGKQRKNEINRIVYRIQKKWIRKGKYPLTRKGWATTAFGKTSIADTRRLVVEALQTAFRQYKDDLAKDLNKRSRTK